MEKKDEKQKKTQDEEDDEDEDPQRELKIKEVEEKEAKQNLAEALRRTILRLDAASGRLVKVEKQLNLSGQRNLIAKRSPSVKEFDAIVEGTIKECFNSTLYTVGEGIEEVMDKLLHVVAAIRSLLVIAGNSKKPPDVELFCKQVLDLISEIVDYVEKNKNVKYSDQLSMIAKTAMSCHWVVAATPVSYVQQQKNAVETIYNKICKDSKRLRTEEFEDYVVAFLRKLEEFVQKHYQNGITWSSNGKDCPWALRIPKKGYQRPSKKNPVPKLQEIDNQWYCLFHIGTGKNTEIDVIPEKKQNCFISHCSEQTVTVKGKVNSVIVDNCFFTDLIITDSVTSVTIINSQRIVLLCNSAVGSITVQRTSGCEVKLSDSQGPEIHNLGSTNLSVAIPKEVTESNDSESSNDLSGNVDTPPTQIKVKIKHGKLQTILAQKEKA